jgi:hypothetical protein
MVVDALKIEQKNKNRGNRCFFIAFTVQEISTTAQFSGQKIRFLRDLIKNGAIKSKMTFLSALCAPNWCD